MSIRYRTAAIGLALCLTAGCGVSGGDDGASTTTSDGPTTTAPTASTASTTTAPTSTTTESSEDADQAVKDGGEATLETSAFTIDSSLDLTAGIEDLSLGVQGSVDYDESVAGVTISVDAADQTGEVEIRSDGTKLWIRPGGSALPEPIPEGKTWVQGKADRLGDSGSFDQTGLLGVLIALRAAEDSERTGTDELDGTEVTLYETTIDYAEAVKVAGDDEESFTSSLSLEAPGTTNLKVELAVGSDGIIRHLDFDVENKSGLVDGTYELDLTDVETTIDAPETPPADDTLTGPKAEKLLDQLVN